MISPFCARASRHGTIALFRNRSSSCTSRLARPGVASFFNEFVFQVLDNPDNFPLNLKFGRPSLTTNEKIVLASMFYPLFALSVQLSPEPGSSGIRQLETDTFTLNCRQTLTGVKFLVVSDPRQVGVDQLLDKLYELYADYALKNPFYSLEMPIRADLFDTNLRVAIDQIEKTGFI